MLHIIFRNVRFRGEWFLGNKDMATWVDEHEIANKDIIDKYPIIEKGRLWGAKS